MHHKFNEIQLPRTDMKYACVKIAILNVTT